MTTDTEDLLWRRFNEWLRARSPDYPSEWDAYQAGYAAALADQKPPAVNDNAGCAAPVNDNAGRWYMLDNNGMATLCASEADALSEAAAADAAWPRNGPHRAVQLVPADQLAAAVAAERERAAMVCERIADDYNQRESLKYAELKTDAETGANECADAIRAGAKEPSDG